MHRSADQPGRSGMAFCSGSWGAGQVREGVSGRVAYASPKYQSSIRFQLGHLRRMVTMGATSRHAPKLSGGTGGSTAMSVVMYRRAMKDLRRAAIWCGLSLAIYGLSMVAFYPPMGTGAAYQQILKVWPGEMLHAFGISDLGPFGGFMGGELLDVMWSLIVVAFLITGGTAVVAQDVERETIERLHSIPLPRRRLLSSKLLTVVVAAVGASAIGALMIGELLTAGGLVGLELLIFSIAMAGYSALVSSLSSKRGRVAGLAAGLTVALYPAFVVAGFSDRWGWLQHLSIFTTNRSQQALARGTMDLPGVAALLAIGAASALAAIRIVEHRDTPR